MFIYIVILRQALQPSIETRLTLPQADNMRLSQYAILHQLGNLAQMHQLSFVYILHYRSAQFIRRAVYYFSGNR